jgi:hypothetical protein
MKLNIRELEKCLYDYECDKSNTLKNKEFLTFNVWNIIRRPLFYKLVNTFFYKENASNLKGESKYTTSLKRLAGVILLPIKLIIYNIRKKDIYIAAKEVYKLEKEENIYINIFADTWYNLYSGNSLYVEYPTRFFIEKEGTIKANFTSDSIQVLIALVTKLFDKFSFYKKEVDDISNEINCFLLREASLKLSRKQISYLIYQFAAEYYVYKVVFYLLKPKLLLCTDSVAAGIMAAAIKRDMKIIEIQHGFVSDFKSDYIITNELREKKNIVIPHKIAVFGEFQRRLLLKSGFWKEDEIVNIGNYRIDKYRKKSIEAVEVKKNILVVIQWHVFDHLKSLLFKLKESSCNVNFYLKMHPREPEEHKAWYKKWCSENTGFIYGDSNDNIYTLMLNSDIVIGFDSTSLLESTALGIPTVTVRSELAPNGIHAYNDDSVLTKTIKCLYDDEVVKVIQEYYSDDNSREEWLNLLKENSNYLFEPSLEKNCKLLVESLI